MRENYDDDSNGSLWSEVDERHLANEAHANGINTEI